jgi:riboflavin biosynthesis pyrimidine reductase
MTESTTAPIRGAGAAQALLRAGLLDELEIHLVPVLLGGGRRLFDSLGPGHIEFELVRRLEGRDVTHLRYQVSR